MLYSRFLLVIYFTHVFLINLFVCDCGMWTTLKYLLLRSKGGSVCISHNQTRPGEPTANILEYFLPAIFYNLFSHKRICLIYSLISCFVDKTKVTSLTSAFFKYYKGTYCPVMEVHTLGVGGRTILFSLW